MAALVCARKGVLQGVFTNKKKLWTELFSIEPRIGSFFIKVSPTKTTNLTYAKLTWYVKERTQLNIYSPEDISKFMSCDNLENCPPTFQIWDCEYNQRYELKTDTFE